ncbi:Similar to tr/Q73K01/Q73K01 (fragment) [Microcystis aeruginosa PCC 9806]|uniref:Similar to tr/Q73K01/Q73K01 n=1 Tax=Microcystis aeruginosa PCC 9806 TaxID=1160282 RepID=I4GU92_MICAE
MQEVYYYSVFQSAEVQKLWVLGKRQEAKVKREEKYVYLTSLGNAIFILNSPDY